MSGHELDLKNEWEALVEYDLSMLESQGSIPTIPPRKEELMGSQQSELRSYSRNRNREFKYNKGLEDWS